MQNDAFGRTIGKCSSCGKDVILRDRRDKKTQYCSRACASQARFKTRYRGTGSGPMDRPKDWEEKKHFRS